MKPKDQQPYPLVKFDQVKLEALELALKTAVEKGDLTLEFESNTLDTRYAEYLVRYLKGKLL